MADIFEEVDESLRKDKTAEWWKKYGIFIWIAGFALIGFVAFREWSTHQETKAIEEKVELFEAARKSLTAGEYADAQTQFGELAGSDVDISPLAAQFLARSYYEGNGDAALAVQTLENHQEDDGPLERIARLKAAYLQTDNMTLPELEAYLDDMVSEPTAVGALALELVAAKAFKEGDLERARTEFGYLRFAPNAPRGVTQRAEIALSVLPEPAPETPTDEAPDTTTTDTEAEETQE